MVHNFSKRSSIFRWTPKKHLLWLLNNTTFFYFSTVQLMLLAWSSLSLITTKSIFQRLFKYGFNQTALKLTLAPLSFKNYPVGTNFSQTIKYWILQKNILCFSNKTWNLPRVFSTNQNFFSRYYVITPINLTRATQKIFRSVFFKFLTILTLTWTHWGSKHRFWVQHTYLSQNFHLLKFLNVYFFKILNI